MTMFVSVCDESAGPRVQQLERFHTEASQLCRAAAAQVTVGGDYEYCAKPLPRPCIAQ